MKKKTVGQIVQENNDKKQTLDDHVREYSNAMLTEVMDEIHQTCQVACKEDQYRNKDFYVVLVKKIHHLTGQPIFQHWTRMSCPTPVYKQDVFKYYHQAGTLEFLWCIPSKEYYYEILHNKQKYLSNKETQRLAQFVILMESGKLLEWVKKENKEKKDAIIMLNKVEH